MSYTFRNTKACGSGQAEQQAASGFLAYFSVGLRNWKGLVHIFHIRYEVLTPHKWQVKSGGVTPRHLGHIGTEPLLALAALVL